MCLETGPDDSHRWWGSDMFRQTVPDTFQTEVRSNSPIVADSPMR